jgi:hypothetical protein
VIARMSVQESDPAQAILALRSRREKHFELGRRIIEAFGGALYGFDILAIASLNRSVSLLSAFCHLIEVRNFISAAPLIRLQLDNAMRLCAANLAADPHEFTVQVMEGAPIKKLKDRSGHLLTDTYLVQSLARRHPWVTSVYDNTSGYIHLSEKHIFNALAVAEGKERSLNMKISDRDEFLSDETYLQAIEAFGAATDVVFEYLEGWAYTKANPQEVAAILRKRKGNAKQDA